MKNFKIDYLKAITHLVALLPLARILYDYWFNQLSANPIRELQFRTGRDALVLLIAALALAPLSSVLGKRILRLRRTLGLYAFFYATLHFLNFIGLDFGFNIGLIVEGIFAKPFALVGFLAFLLLIPLAATSTNGWIRRLGKNWKRLHRFIYLAAVLVIIHFLWAAKAGPAEPLAYGAVVLLLLILRLFKAVKSR